MVVGSAHGPWEGLRRHLAGKLLNDKAREDHLAHAVDSDEADLVVLVELVAVGRIEYHFQ